MTPGEIVAKLRALGRDPLVTDYGDVLLGGGLGAAPLPRDLRDAWLAQEPAIADYLRAEQAAATAGRAFEVQSLADGAYFARTVDEATEAVVIEEALRDMAGPDQ